MARPIETECSTIMAHPLDHLSDFARPALSSFHRASDSKAIPAGKAKHDPTPLLEFIATAISAACAQPSRDLPQPSNRRSKSRVAHGVRREALQTDQGCTSGRQSPQNSRHWTLPQGSNTHTSIPKYRSGVRNIGQHSPE
jgi:hypothetical protein